MKNPNIDTKIKLRYDMRSKFENIKYNWLHHPVWFHHPVSKISLDMEMLLKFAIELDHSSNFYSEVFRRT